MAKALKPYGYVAGYYSHVAEGKKKQYDFIVIYRCKYIPPDQVPNYEILPVFGDKLKGLQDFMTRHESDIYRGQPIYSHGPGIKLQISEETSAGPYRSHTLLDQPRLRAKPTLT
jgi:hypothetical protein